MRREWQRPSPLTERVHLPWWLCRLSGLSIGVIERCERYWACGREGKKTDHLVEKMNWMKGREDRNEMTNDWSMGKNQGRWIRGWGLGLDKSVKSKVWERWQIRKSSMCIWQLLLGIHMGTSKWSSTNTIARIYSKMPEFSNGKQRKTCFLGSVLLGPWWFF